MIKKIAFVGQPTRDLERATAFYRDVLGLEQDMDGSHPRWHEFKSPDGKTIALDTFGPEFLGDNARPYLSLEVEDLESFAAELEGKGVQFVMPMTVNRNDAGKEICRMAVVLDTEGNAVMLHQIADWRA